ncbi:MAG: exopolysaccharide biosynthesis protein [Rickettsiaceae bacterium]|nr:exopolysaccharide biosynthesis protein [Rickettsiaceae bacterium]
MFKNRKPKLLDTAFVSEILEKVGQKQKGDKTKISELMEDFHENGILLAMIFFSLPVAIPLPYPPGFTTVMGIPLMILSIQMLLGNKKVSLPQKINDYELKNSTLRAISDKVVPRLVSVEKYVKPRFSFAKSVYCEQFIGFISLLAAFSVALPIPLTNAIPALGIAVMALGLLNRDGLVIIVGFFITVIGLLVAIGAVLASWVAIKYIFHSIF